MAVITKDLGAVSAYAVAVANGFTGTEAEWEQYMADAANNAMNAAGSATAAANSAASAAQSATEAATSKVAAAGSAVDAENSALVAGNHAAAAAASATAAETAETGAETAQSAAEAAQAAAEAVAASIPEDYTELTEEVGSLKSALLPTIVRIKDNIYSTNGGIYYSTQVHRNSANVRRTNPYFVKSGQKVIAYLTATRDWFAIAAYTSTTISAANFISGIRAKENSTQNRYEYTATQDCYVIFTTAPSLVNACAYIYDDYLDGDKIIYLEKDGIKNALISGNKIIPELIQYNTTIDASGTVGIKSGDAVSNKININNESVISVHSWGAYWLSINYYGNSGFISRREYTGAVIPEDYNFFISAKIPENTTYIMLCAATVSGKILKLNAFLGATVETKYVENTEADKYSAFVDSAAHRGFTVGFPENSLVSTSEAKKHGFIYAENDVRFTSDGVAVLLHDESINRVARNADGTEISGTINIADITYEQALTYDFGRYAGDQYAGTTICTLEEQINLCKKIGLGLIIEAKVANHASDIVGLVKKYGMEDNVIYAAFSSTTLSQIVTLAPKATVMLIRSEFSAEFLAACVALKNGTNTVYADLDYTSTLTDSNVADLIDANIKLAFYTVDFIDRIPLLNPYVSLVTSSFYPANIVLAYNELSE